MEPQINALSSTGECNTSDVIVNEEVRHGKERKTRVVPSGEG
jgi:hypothetical protein